MLPYDPKSKRISRALRRNMTEAEGQLWARLRRKQLLGVQFFRQKPLANFVADFCAPSVGLVIELDGSQHYLPDGLAHDASRDAALIALGITVLRFCNHDTLRHTDSVVQASTKKLNGAYEKPRIEIPPAPLYPKGGESGPSFEGGAMCLGVNDVPEHPEAI